MHVKGGILSVASHGCLATDNEMILLEIFTKQTEERKNIGGYFLIKSSELKQTDANKN